MSDFNLSLVDMKAITIGMVSEITGLSQRQIRYYEERNLISPGRALQGYRIYSFSDIKRLIEIAEQIEEGVQTYEIRKEFIEKQKSQREQRYEIRKGQINSQFSLF